MVKTNYEAILSGLQLNTGYQPKSDLSDEDYQAGLAEDGLGEDSPLVDLVTHFSSRRL